MSRKKQNTQKAMVAHIAYRFYGVPTEDDAILEAKTFGCCRFLWNRMLYDHNTIEIPIATVLLIRKTATQSRIRMIATDM